MSEKLVYLMEHEHGPVKIGRSSNPEQRLGQIQRFCPYNLQIRTTIEVVNDIDHVGFTVEKGLHYYYRAYWRKGEWYDLPEGEVVALEAIGRLSASELVTLRHELGYDADRFDPDDTILDRLRGVWCLNHRYDGQVAKL